MSDTIGLDELVRNIMDNLGEADAKYRAWVADKIHASYNDDDDVLEGIEEILMDPNTKGRYITDLATEILTDSYSYEGDGVVSVTADPSFAV